MKTVLQIVIISFIVSFPAYAEEGSPRVSRAYEIVDTGVKEFYDNTSIIPEPKPGQPFYGQDAQYRINNPSYSDNGDGTITDNVTGLMWQRVVNEKMTFEEAFQQARDLELAGHRDWRRVESPRKVERYPRRMG